jgi:excisionase family DNA binding protein
MKKDGPPDSSEIMNLRDLADYLKCHPGTVYRLLKGGEIPAFRLGSDWRFSRADIDRWIARRQVSPGAGKAAPKPKRRGRKRQKGQCTPAAPPRSP